MRIRALFAVLAAFLLLESGASAEEREPENMCTGLINKSSAVGLNRFFVIPNGPNISFSQVARDAMSLASETPPPDVAWQKFTNVQTVDGVWEFTTLQRTRVKITKLPSGELSVTATRQDGQVGTGKLTC